MSDTEQRVFTLEIELELATQTIQEMQIQIDSLRQDVDYYRMQYERAIEHMQEVGMSTAGL